jgi:hypothetical protein
VSHANSNQVCTNLSIHKAAEILYLRGAPVSKTGQPGTGNHLANPPAVNDLFHLPYCKPEGTLYPNNCRCIVFCCESCHFSNNLQVALKWPFDEHRFPRYDAGAYALEVPVYSNTADDEVYITVGGEVLCIY